MSPSKNPIPIGVIGAGNISDQYLTNIGQYPDMEIVAIADLIPEKAQAQAQKYGIPTWGTNEVVLDNPDVQLVINITTPDAHVEVSTDAVNAGKHVWSEKVIGVDRDGAKNLLAAAKKAGKRVGVAPDTVLGPGVQTAKRLIARGDIGVPLYATTLMQFQGPELFHPNPAFLYAAGAGPLLDMGPYYVSTLLHVLGPVAAVAAVGLKGRETRAVEIGDLKGQEFPVEVPTTVQALLRFDRGGSAQSLFSDDSAVFRQGIVEIHGSEGTLIIPDPNTFGGDITLIRPLTKMIVPPEPFVQEEEIITMPEVLGGRGIGALDMLQSEAAGRDHVANGEFGYHVLDTLLSIEEACESGQWVDVNSDPGVIRSIGEGFNPFVSSLS